MLCPSSFLRNSGVGVVANVADLDARKMAEKLERFLRCLLRASHFSENSILPNENLSTAMHRFSVVPLSFSRSAKYCY